MAAHPHPDPTDRPSDFTPELGNAVDAPSDLKQALSGFFAARVELASIEAKEAAGFVSQKIVHAVIMAACGFFIWCLVLAGITGVLAPIVGGWLADSVAWLPGWCAVLFGLALLHAIVALICLMRLKKKPSEELFGLTRQELENDKQWLKRNK
ncbi:phage holin family protein [Verrucomicrobiaceae bacterium R5-34]|uniref:Phage holin family protein n=1 Tax=Oceaniferula flava TaxID=2800421 RepID=A0AAE2SBC3_9BACT|nr:phage holin family protein [Oceaniferula flavus]MBK1831443.1 phage holin family protein [Verrucomicrobiaceae bacterium R5-34]MBK1854317.1 phage holin family protein [Oceaniferula flavus]MBM1135623.1 phage holin family protein [Oceaniferula flavus]